MAGDGETATRAMTAFYGLVVDKVVPVSTTQTAEAVKISENIFRAVNIALVNELKVIFDALDIDVWEVIDAAATMAALKASVAAPRPKKTKSKSFCGHPDGKPVVFSTNGKTHRLEFKVGMKADDLIAAVKAFARSEL